MKDQLDPLLQKAAGIKMDRRSLVLGAGLAAAGGLYYLREPAASAKPVKQENFSAAIPDNVAGWTSRKSQEVVLPPQDESDGIYENIETRIYEGPGLPAMMLLVAFSSVQQDNIQVHRPEVCYPVAGFPIIWTRPTQIDLPLISISGRELLADRGGVRERILYWVRVGEKFPTSWAQQRLIICLLYTSPSPRDRTRSRMPSSA